MKVFISWSGERSKAAAELLNEWIPYVIHAIDPWISTEDIDKGTTWFKKITDKLTCTSIGIVCLTPENKNNPWILFESGALLSGLTEARVYTFLIDLNPTDVENPLAQFNHTTSVKADMFKLLKSLNDQVDTHKLNNAKLRNVFDKYWPDFEKPFKKILASKPKKKAKVEPRSGDSMMEEMLSTVRSLEQRLSEKEQNSTINSNPERDSMHLYNLVFIAKQLIEKGFQPSHIFSELTKGVFPARKLLGYGKKQNLNLLKIRMSFWVNSQSGFPRMSRENLFSLFYLIIPG